MAEIFYKKQAEQLSDEQLLKSVAVGVSGSTHSLTVAVNNLSELISRLYGRISALEDSLAESIELATPNIQKKRGRPPVKEELEEQLRGDGNESTQD